MSHPYKVSRLRNLISYVTNNKYILVSIIVLTFLCYYKLLFAEFLYYDDDVLLINNSFIKHIDFELLKNSFGFTNITHYHPLVYLSFALEYYLFGLNPLYFHFTNITLHCVNVLLLFVLLKKIGLNDFINCLTVLFFAFHPMHTESVAWVTERKDLLYAAFYFGAILFHISYSINRKKIFYFGSLILFVLSCLSKAMAVTLPLVLILIDHLMEGDVKKKYKQYLPYILFSILISVINLKVAFFITNPGGFGIIDMLVLTLYSLIFYPYKILFPFNLSAIYAYPQSIAFIHYASAFLAILLIILFFAFNRNKFMRFSVIFYLITIIPVLPIVPFGISITADRFAYIPATGIFIVITCCIYNSYLYVAKESKAYKLIYRICITGIFVLLAVLSLNRSGKWMNTETLMNNVLDYDHKNYYAYFILGNYYSAGSFYQKAEISYQLCINLKPDYTDAILNLGISEFHLKKYGQAVKCFKRVIDINPSDMEAYNNLGVVYENNGEFDEAIKNYMKSASLGYEPAIVVLKYYGYEW